MVCKPCCFGKYCKKICFLCRAKCECFRYIITKCQKKNVTLWCLISNDKIFNFQIHKQDNLQGPQKEEGNRIILNLLKNY